MLNGIFKFKQCQICNVSAVSHLVNLLCIMITEKIESRYNVTTTNIVVLCNQIKYNKIFDVFLYPSFNKNEMLQVLCLIHHATTYWNKIMY